MLTFEFFALHSTPVWILASIGKIPRWPLLIYVPFVVGAAVAFDAFWLAAFFLWHLAAVAWHNEVEGGGDEDEYELALRFMRYIVLVMIFLATPLAVWLLPLPALGWTAGTIPWDLAMELGSGELLYYGLPAQLTIYFTLRTVWHAYWWHLSRTGGALSGGRPHRPPRSLPGRRR